MALLAVVELVGVASIFPFMALLAEPEQLTGDGWMARVYATGGFPSERRFIITAGVAVLLLIIVSRLFGWAINYWRDRLEWHIYLRTSSRLLNYYVDRPYAYFTRQNTSDLRSYITNETMNLVQGILVPTITLMIQGGTALLIAVLLLVVNPVVALTAAALLGGTYFLIFYSRKGPIERLGDIRLNTGMRRQRVLEELFTGIKTIKAYGNEAVFLERYRKETTLLADVNPRLRVIYQLPKVLLEILAFGGVITVTLYLYIRNGDLITALPTLTLFAAAGYRLLPALQGIFGALSTMRTFRPTLVRLRPDLLAALAYETRPPVEQQPLPFTERLMLDSVGFRFPEAETALFDNLTLQIDKGSTVAFVGTTGSGKTTAADLLTGLLQPTSGQVLVDGQELNEHTAAAWRKQIAYVPQDVYLYDVSLRENITFGHPDPVTDEEIMEVLQRVELADFVQQETAAGLDTPLGENGVRLSGGQRQRIGLARALLRRPTLLVLDEATSALDDQTEAAVMAAIARLPKALTVLVIAHRLGTVEGADVTVDFSSPDSSG